MSEEGPTTPNPANPYFTPPTTQELFLRGLGSALQGIGASGSRTLHGQIIRGGAGLAGGLGSAYGDAMAAQRADPITRQLQMAQAIQNQGTVQVASVPSGSLEPYALPAQFPDLNAPDAVISPIPVGLPSGFPAIGAAPKPQFSVSNLPPAWQAIAAKEFPQTYDPVRQLQAEHLKQEIKKPVLVGPDTTGYDPNDPSKVIIEPRLTENERRIKEKEKIATEWRAEIGKEMARHSDPKFDPGMAAENVFNRNPEKYGEIAGSDVLYKARQDTIKERQRQAHELDLVHRQTTAQAATAARQQAHEAFMQKNLQDPVLNYANARLFVKTDGTSFDTKEVVGKRASQLPENAIALSSVQQRQGLSTAKGVIDTGEALKQDAAEILTKYKGRNISQFLEVQGNRVLLKGAAGAGDPKLKAFAAHLNNYLIALPQAEGIPGGRESARLIEMFSKGAPTLGDTVESLGAAVDANRQDLARRWAATGVDLNPAKAGPPSPPPGASSVKRMIYDRSGNLVQSQ